MSAWLVTGGCGFIGTNLIRSLVAAGDGVRVLDSLTGGDRSTLAEAAPFTEVTNPSAPPAAGTVELLVGDVRSAEQVRAALVGIDTVAHLAAQTGVLPSIEKPLEDAEVNVLGTLVLLDEARRAGNVRLVVASSNAPLGETDGDFDESTAPRPLSPYGAAKLAAEAYVSAFAGSYALPAVALRFANAYGPLSRRKGSAIALFCRRILAGEPIVIYGDGSQTRDFVHVDDLVAALRAAAVRGAPGGIYQIASGRETSVAELVERLSALAAADLGRAPEIRHEPARAGEVRRSRPRIDRARRELGWEPRVDLDRGLAGVWGWFRSEATP